VDLDRIESVTYPTDAQLDCSKNAKIYVTIYMRGALTCFGFLEPSSGSYYMCFAKVISINESVTYPTDAQLDCSKNAKIYITIYMRGALTCFGFLEPSSESYYMCFAKVISINNQLKYVVYRISSV
jgi:hypothetical protein